MKIRRVQEEFESEYAYWSKLPFMFRVVSFRAMQDIEAGREVKTIAYRVLEKLSH